MVVDDEAHVRNVLERAITQLGHEAVVVEDAAAALAQLREGAFDLLLAGGELATQGWEETRAAVEMAEPPPDVILVAPVASHQNAVVGARIGAADCIEKPITHLRFVREKIRMLLERRWLRAEVQRLRAENQQLRGPGG